MRPMKYARNAFARTDDKADAGRDIALEHAGLNRCGIGRAGPKTKKRGAEDDCASWRETQKIHEELLLIGVRFRFHSPRSMKWGEVWS
jgi:hypothetical protein